MVVLAYNIKLDIELGLAEYKREELKEKLINLNQKNYEMQEAIRARRAIKPYVDDDGYISSSGRLLYIEPYSDGDRSDNRDNGDNSSMDDKLDRKQIEQKILEVFGGDTTAVKIAKAESQLDPDAIGDLHLTFLRNGKKYGMSCGVFQIRVLPGRPSCEELLDVEKNIEYAKKLYDESGWYPWSTYKNGKYLEYLN